KLVTSAKAPDQLSVPVGPNPIKVLWAVIGVPLSCTSKSSCVGEAEPDQYKKAAATVWLAFRFKVADDCVSIIHGVPIPWVLGPTFNVLPIIVKSYCPKNCRYKDMGCEKPEKKNINKSAVSIFLYISSKK